MKTKTSAILKSEPAENGAAPPVIASSKLASEVWGEAANAGSRVPERSGPDAFGLLQPQSIGTYLRKSAANRTTLRRSAPPPTNRVVLLMGAAARACTA